MKEKKSTGLNRDKQLRVIKTAGFKAAKKDKSVNRRAGLHDKKKNLSEGERRVMRCKPLALKHKRRMRKAAALLAAVAVGAVSYVGLGFLFTPDGLFVEDLGNYTVKAQKREEEASAFSENLNAKEATGEKVYYFPEDGSLPTEHTLIENVAYLNYVLSEVKPCWSSYMESTVYTVMQQHVYTHKKSYGDKETENYSFISADMAVGASNTARQFCVTEGEVIWREADGEISLESMDETDWNDETFYGNTIAEFRSFRGLPANEFSVYILDELTVKNANEKTVKDNGDGTYTMTLDLKVHQSGLDSAVHYYKQQMYVTGGLYAWPTFDYTRVTYSFTADWTLLSFTINDAYSAKMGVISAGCSSESTTTFTYDDEAAQNTYRQDVFAPHENGNYERYSPFGNTISMDAATCLANAFGSVLEEGAILNVELGLNGRQVNGTVYLGLNEGSISDLRVALGGLGIYLGEDNGKNMLYVAVGEDKFKLCTDKLFASSESDGEQSGSALDGILDVNDLMNQLFKGEFTLDENSATLKSELSLFGLEIPLEFSFDVNGKEVSLNYIKSDFSLNGSPVSVKVTFGTEKDIPAQLTAAEKSAYSDILNEGLTLDLAVGLDGLTLNGMAHVELSDGNLTGVTAQLGDIKAFYLAAGNEIYLDISGYKYKLGLNALLGGSAKQAKSGEDGGLSLQQLISWLVGGISTNGNGINFNGALNAENGLDILGLSIKLGVEVNLKGSLGVNANFDVNGKKGFAQISVAHNATLPELGNKQAYTDILNEGIKLGVNVKVDGLTLAGVVEIAMKEGKLSQVSAQLGDLTIYYTASDNTLYYADKNGAKYKLGLDALIAEGSSGVDLSAILGGLDIETLIKEIIDNFTAKNGTVSTSATLNLLEQIIPLAAEINLNGGISVNANTEVFEKAVALSVGLTNDGVPALVAKEYTDILNEGIKLGVNVKVDGLTLAGVVEIAMKEGKLAQVSAQLGDLTIYYTASDNTLYYADKNGAKYKLGLNSLIAEGSGSGADLSAILGGLDIETLINEIIDNFTAKDGTVSTSATLNLLEQIIPLAAEINLNGGISVNANTEVFEKAVSLSVGLTNDGVPALVAKEYTDVLNEGIKLGVNVKVDGLTLAGVVEIAMNEGKLAQVSAQLGDLTIYYTANDNTLYYADKNGAKYKLGLNALIAEGSSGVDLSAILGGLDINALITEIIDNFTAKDGTVSTSATLNLLEQIIPLAAEINLNGGISVNANTEVFEKAVSLSVGLTNDSVPALVANEYTDILNEGIVLSANITVDGLKLSGEVYLGLSEGKLTEVRASLKNDNGSVGVYFDSVENELYIAAGNGVKVKLPLSVLIGGQTEATSDEGENENGEEGESGNILDDILGSIDIKDIISQAINNLVFADGKINTSASAEIAALKGVLNIGAAVNLQGGIGAAVDISLLNKAVSVSASLENGATVTVPALSDEEKLDYIDVLNDGFNVSGTVSVTAGETNLELALNKLSIKLSVDEDGAVDFAVALDARITVDGIYFDIYLSYESGVLSLVYGEVDAEDEENSNYVGVTLDIDGGDLTKLEEALVAVYNRISAVLDEIVTNNPLKPTDKDGLEKALTMENIGALLEKFGVAISLGSGAGGVLDMLGLPTDNEKLNIAEFIKGLSIYSPEDSIFGVTAGNLSLQLKNAGLSASLNIELSNSSTRVLIQNVAISAYDKPVCPVEYEKLLCVNDFIDMLDYVGAAVELLIEDEYSLSASVSVFENDAVAYEVNILFEYIKGKSFPVHVTVPSTDADGNSTGTSVTFDSDMYWHLGVSLVRADKTEDDSNEETKDDLYIDIYILDANPTIADGKTTSAATTEGNGLDIYLSVSKYDTTNANYAPLKLYAPVNEVLTVLSAGIAILDLQNIDVRDEAAELQTIIDKVAAILNDALVNTYLPYTHSQFQSLGASLIPQFIGDDLSGLLKDILGKLSAPPADEDENEETPVVASENEDGGEQTTTPSAPVAKYYINKVGLSTGEDGGRTLTIALNSAAIYGEGYSNLTFEAYKNYYYVERPAEGEVGEGEGATQLVKDKSYITGAAVKNIYFGGTQKLDLGLNVVRKVNRVTEFDEYYDLSGIDTFLKAFVNSATHKSTLHDNAIAEQLNRAQTEFTLNHYYLIRGNVVASVLGIKIDIDTTLSVTIDEYTNDVIINAHLEYEGKWAYVTAAINGNTAVDLTIKDGMIYIKRVQTTKRSLTGNSSITPITIYRAMPLSEFGSAENLMDNIGFILNFGDFINNQLQGVEIGGSTLELDGCDYGEIIGTFLKSFTHTSTATSASWTLTMSGDGLTKLVGMTMDDLVVTFLAETGYDSVSNSNAYLVTGLKLKTNMVLLKGVVELDVNGNLTYCNPQESMKKGYEDKAENTANMWEELFGCSSKTLATAVNGLEEGKEYSDEVRAVNALWTKAVASLNTGKKYLEVNMSSSTGVNLGEVALNTNGKKTGGIKILYGDKVLLSVPADIPEWKQIDGYTLSVTYSGVSADLESGKLGFAGVTDFANTSINAVYTPNIYKVTVILDEAGTTYQFDYTYDTTLSLANYIGNTATSESGAEYTLIAFDCGDNRYYGNVEKFNTLCDVTLVAVWSEKVENAEYTITYVADGKPVETLTAVYGDTIDQSVIPDIEVTGYDFIGWDVCGVSTVYGNREIYAVYAPHVYTITLNVDEWKGCGKEGQLAEAVAEAGFADGKLYYTYGNEAVKLNALNSISGYDFVRYYTLDEKGEEISKTEITSVYMLAEDITIYAEYNDVRISLNLTSDVAFTYNGQTATEKDGKYELSTYIIREESAMLDAENAESYSFLGWWYASEDESETVTYNKLADALLIARPGETATTEIRALWGKADITGKSTKSGSFLKGYDYTMVSTANYEFKGFEGLIEKINRTATEYDWYLDNGLTPVMTKEVNNVNGNNQLTCTFDKLHITSTSGIMNNWKVSCRLTFGLPDGTGFVLSATSSGKF